MDNMRRYLRSDAGEEFNPLRLIGLAQKNTTSWGLSIYLFALICVALAVVVLLYLIVPEPRQPTLKEKTYRTLDKDGNVTDPTKLPCWLDRLHETWKESLKRNVDARMEKDIEPAEIFMTVVVPAYNEEKRLIGMLEETTNFLERNYGTLTSVVSNAGNVTTTGSNSNNLHDLRSRKSQQQEEEAEAEKNNDSSPHARTGWEILIIDDGSTDRTIEIAQNFARTHLLPMLPRRQSGPWTHRSKQPAVNIPPDSIRMVSLSPNRGKGGAVTHGMRHARGEYVVFADADGASDIKDLTKLVTACQTIEDKQKRGVAVGSRAHLVGSEAVVKRSKLRNFLMHSFHLLLKFMTPPKTARIRDTQCGFKLFSRASLPFIVPHMHTEGWIFDVEMLMLAEFADIPVAEVPVGWREVVGSKLNVITDSIGMAWGLAILRFCWGVGIYRM